MKKTVCSIAVTLMSGLTMAEEFRLVSHDIAHGEFMPKAQEFAGFGCDGGNQSPHLSWTGAPKGTESFAVFAYDPDAPTGSGWWHWQMVNIPKQVTELPADAGSPAKKGGGEGSVAIRNDYGIEGFGGACPPVGHGAHRYQFTVFALPQKLELPPNPSSALVGFLVNSQSLGSARIEALYKR